MDEQDKARLAKQALQAADMVKPGEIKQRMKASVKNAAGNAALRTMAAVGRLTGGGGERLPARSQAAQAVDISGSIDAMDGTDLMAFEARLQLAAARQAAEQRAETERYAAAARREAEQQARELREAARGARLAELRRSFPEASQQLALLIFNCVDLLDDLADDVAGQPPSAKELARKEKLLSRFAELLAPRADEGLKSFVAHVVQLSQSYRDQ